MSYQIWNTLFLISLISTVISGILTIIFTIKFKIISDIKFQLNKNKPATVSENFRSEIKKNSVTSPVTHNIHHQQSYIQGTVVVKDHDLSKTAASSDSFILTKNIVIIHADPSVIKNI